MAPPLCGARVVADGVACTARAWKNVARRRGEGKKKLAKNSRGNVVPPRATLSSRVTGTRRESAYNERALSVCALLFTCLRASRRVVSRRVASGLVQPSTLSTDAPPLPPSRSLPLSASFLLFPGNRSRRARCVREGEDVCADGGCVVVAHERGWMGEYTRLPVRA